MMASACVTIHSETRYGAEISVSNVQLKKK